MLKVIIVDDEPRICQMITVLIDWQSLGYQIIGTASNGNDALRLVDELHPDVMITDIRIPGINGIELIEQAKITHPELDFIIISGFRHFDYAYSAIQSGVEYYLLKPIEEEDLIHALKKIREKREKSEQSRLYQKQAEVALHETKQNRRITLVHSLYKGEEAITDIDTLNKAYSCSFAAGIFQSVILHLDSTRNNPSEKHLLSVKFQESVTMSYASVTGLYDLVTGDTPYGICIILNYPEELSEQILSCHSQLFEYCRRHADTFNGYHVTLGISSERKDISCLGELIRQSRAAIRSRIISGTDRMIYASDCSSSGNKKSYFTARHETELRLLIENNRQEDLERWFHAFCSELSGLSTLSADSLYQTCRDLLEAVSFILHKLPDSVFSRSGFDQESSQVINEPSMRQLFSGICNLIQKHMQQYFSQKSQETSHMVRAAREYIKNHYAEPIRLEDAARAATYHPNYFSGVFKQETGMNFSEYLTEVRIDAAKELLRNTRMSIRAVAEQVGYKDEKHFSKSFKKTVGVSPKDYRKLYA